MNKNLSVPLAGIEYCLRVREFELNLIFIFTFFVYLIIAGECKKQSLQIVQIIERSQRTTKFETASVNEDETVRRFETETQKLNRLIKHERMEQPASNRSVHFDKCGNPSELGVLTTKLARGFVTTFAAGLRESSRAKLQKPQSSLCSNGKYGQSPRFT